MGSGSSVLESARGVSIQCKVWLNASDPEFVYPEQRPGVLSELDSKDNFGIAVSGGGFRAASCALGFLRAMHLQGLLSQAKYLSSNSGGSWVTGPLSFIDQDMVDVFMGPYCPPENCTPEFLSSEPLKLSSEAAIAKNFVAENLEEIFRLGSDSRTWWCRGVGEIFFQDLGLNGNDLLPALPNRPQDADSILSYRSCGDLKSRPFVIVNGSVLVKGSSVFCPVEFTPLYYGIPIKAPLISSDDSSTTIVHIGDCFTEPAGYTSKLNEAQLQAVTDAVESAISKGLNEITAVVPKASAMISISESCGISSSNLAEAYAPNLSALTVSLTDMVPYHNYWSASTGYVGSLGYADGGGCDNSGILALLRRGVTKVMAFHSAHKDLLLFSESDLTDPATSPVGEFAGMFGRATNGYEGRTTEEFNAHHHVFRSEDWDSFVAALREKAQSGGPVAHLYKGTVLANAKVGTKKEYEVSLLIFLNAKCADWENNLPEATKAQLDNDRNSTSALVEKLSLVGGDANLQHFPYIPVKKLNYSHTLVAAMSQLSSWQVMQSKALIDEFLNQC